MLREWKRGREDERRRESERERALLRVEKKEEKKNGKGMTMVKGRGTKVGVVSPAKREWKGVEREREERIPAESSSPRRLE